jgi:hypothetical protein
MGNDRQAVRTGLIVAFSTLFLLGTAAPGSATGNIVKSDLKGTWQISLRGSTACGFVSMRATMTFGLTGVGTGPLTIHGDCGDSTLTGQTFTVTKLAGTGGGSGTLTCGASCLWHFEIQVAPDRKKFNLADVTFTETDTFLDGVAIASSVADNIVVADMKGEWQVSLMGHQISPCGATKVSGVGTLTLNPAGAGSMNATLKSTCGNGDVVNAFAISGLNADGSGAATLDCGGGCQFTFSIQVSSDRSMFNLVTVSPADAGEFLAGVAIRRSTAGHIVKTNLFGKWQATIFGEELDGDVAAVLATFTLNAKGTSTNVATVGHDTEGDGTQSGGILSITTLNPDGSGVMCVAIDCETSFRIQVSPDRSMMSVVSVDPATEDLLIGLAIHK